MNARGPIYWGRPAQHRAPHYEGLWLAGTRLAVSTPAASWQHPDDLPSGQAVDGSDLFALHVADPTRPVSFQRFQGEVEIQLHTLEQKQTLQWAESASRAGEFLPLFWGQWGMDVWSLALADPEQTTWQTYRGTPWHLPGIDPQDYPAQAWVLDPAVNQAVQTDLTVLGAGSPQADEVTVPGGPQPFQIETAPGLPAGHPGGFLVLFYPMVPQGRVRIDWNLPGANDLKARLTFTEGRG